MLINFLHHIDTVILNYEKLTKKTQSMNSFDNDFEIYVSCYEMSKKTLCNNFWNYSFETTLLTWKTEIIYLSSSSSLNTKIIYFDGGVSSKRLLSKFLCLFVDQKLNWEPQSY